jgi:hypothetical protein
MIQEFFRGLGNEFPRGENHRFNRKRIRGRGKKVGSFREIGSLRKLDFILIRVPKWIEDEFARRKLAAVHSGSTPSS